LTTPAIGPAKKKTLPQVAGFKQRARTPEESIGQQKSMQGAFRPL